MFTRKNLIIFTIIAFFILQFIAPTLSIIAGFFLIYLLFFPRNKQSSSFDGSPTSPTSNDSEISNNISQLQAIHTQLLNLKFSQPIFRSYQQQITLALEKFIAACTYEQLSSSDAPAAVQATPSTTTFSPSASPTSAAASSAVAPVTDHKLPVRKPIDSTNILLFIGALLIIVAAAIFVSFNYSNLSSVFKFSSLSLLTLTFYGSGLYLYQRKSKLKPAGITFLIIGLTFFPLLGVGFTTFFPAINPFSVAIIFALITFLIYSFTFTVIANKALIYLSSLAFIVFEQAFISRFQLPFAFHSVLNVFTAVGLLFVINRRSHLTFNRDLNLIAQIVAPSSLLFIFTNPVNYSFNLAFTLLALTVFYLTNHFFQAKEKPLFYQLANICLLTAVACFCSFWQLSTQSSLLILGLINYVLIILTQLAKILPPEKNINLLIQSGLSLATIIVNLIQPTAFGNYILVLFFISQSSLYFFTRQSTWRKVCFLNTFIILSAYIYILVTSLQLPIPFLLNICLLLINFLPLFYYLLTHHYRSLIHFSTFGLLAINYCLGFTQQASPFYFWFLLALYLFSFLYSFLMHSSILTRNVPYLILLPFIHLCINGYFASTANLPLFSVLILCNALPFIINRYFKSTPLVANLTHLIIHSVFLLFSILAVCIQAEPLSLTLLISFVLSYLGLYLSYPNHRWSVYSLAVIYFGFSFWLYFALPCFFPHIHPLLTCSSLLLSSLLPVIHSLIKKKYLHVNSFFFYLIALSSLLLSLSYYSLSTYPLFLLAQLAAFIFHACVSSQRFSLFVSLYFPLFFIFNLLSSLSLASGTAALFLTLISGGFLIVYYYQPRWFTHAFIPALIYQAMALSLLCTIFSTHALFIAALLLMTSGSFVLAYTKTKKFNFFTIALTLPIFSFYIFNYHEQLFDPRALNTLCLPWTCYFLVLYKAQQFLTKKSVPSLLTTASLFLIVPSFLMMIQNHSSLNNVYQLIVLGESLSLIVLGSFFKKDIVRNIGILALVLEIIFFVGQFITSIPSYLLFGIIGLIFIASAIIIIVKHQK